MKNITRWLVLLVVCIMVAATSCGRRHSADVFATSLDSIFLSLFPDPSEPGAIVLVAKGDSIIYDRGSARSTPRSTPAGQSYQRHYLV